MANPQRENGHIDIANDIAEALARIQLSGYESRILWVILRKTYGWHKKMDFISITQFEKCTKLKRRHVVRSLQRLLERNIITKNGNSFITKWGLQKDYEKWKETVTNSGNKMAKTQTHQQSTQTVTKIGNITKNGNDLVTNFGKHKRKERKYNNNVRKLKFSNEHLQLSDFLISLIKQNKPDYVFRGKNYREDWANEIRLMEEKDKRKIERIKEVIEFSQNHPFWKTNILSAGKLREQFDVLEMQMKRKQKEEEEEYHPPYEPS